MKATKFLEDCQDSNFVFNLNWEKKEELDKRFIDKEELKKKLRKWARECHKEAKESKSTENRTDLLILKHALREIVKKIDTLGGEDGKR